MRLVIGGPKDARRVQHLEIGGPADISAQMATIRHVLVVAGTIGLALLLAIAALAIWLVRRGRRRRLS